MVVILVGNSYSQIKGLDPKQFKQLRVLMSYKDTAGSFYGGFPRIKHTMDIKGVFATGLLKRVQNFVTSQSLKLEIVHGNKSVKPGSVDHKFDLGEIIPYEDQIAAVYKTVIWSRGTIAMPTGTGKSLVIALIVARLGVKSLIVVPNLEIKRQLQASFTTMFETMKNITIENIDSPKLKSPGNYDLLIIDEAHHVGAKTYHKLNKLAWNGIYYRYFLTATPFRNDADEQLLFEGIAGQIIYKLSYQTAISKRYIVPVEAYYIEIPKQKTDAHTWQQVYRQLVVENEVRNQIIINTMNFLYINHKSTLCLVKEIKHGNYLSEKSAFLFANGQDDNSPLYVSKFNSGSQAVLIATEGLLGEGVDTKPCEFVIIAGLGKAKSSLMQKIGRAVRTYPGKESAKIILIYDKSHKFARLHFREQCAILKEEYNVEPIKLEIE